MNKFTTSSEHAMVEDQGSSFMCKHKANNLPMVARTKLQHQDIPKDQDKKIEVDATRSLTLIMGITTSKAHMHSDQNIRRDETLTRERWAQINQPKKSVSIRPCPMCGSTHPFFVAVWPPL
jgi:recombination DNA repair RAD52 pathway protein